MTAEDEVEYILTECFITLGQNVGNQMVSPDAGRFWRTRYHERFLATLTRDHPRAWMRDRLNVLAKAAALGRTAAALAAEDGATAISEHHARQASEANDCRPRSRYGLFSIWCVPPEERREPTEESVSRPWYHRVLQSLAGSS